MKKKIKYLVGTLFILIVLVVTLESSAYYDLEAMYKTLDEYQEIAFKGGWPTIPEGTDLKLNDYDDRVVIIRERLQLTGDLEGGIETQDPKLFDEFLETGVKKFQENHGLENDGIVDQITLRELNISIEKRINQVDRNIIEMEKYSEEFEREYIIVNIPDFQMKYLSNKETIIEKKVIVGRQWSKTPVFNDKITYLVFHPTWVIPFNTAVRTYLPSVRENKDYFTIRDIRVFKRYNGVKSEVNPDNIDWLQINSNNFIYQLEQEAGPENPMGVVKFKFPNKYSVYLHGTPDKELFNKRLRMFSLGCVRLENPVELAKLLLKEYPIYTEIDEILQQGITKTVFLKKPLAIYIVYWTVWVSDSGEVNFRKDIYDRFLKE